MGQRPPHPQRDPVPPVCLSVSAQRQFVRDGLGIGPGMWLAQLLVNLHDGHIWADNQEGRGNCFSFTLSRQPAAAEGRMLLRDSPDSFQRDYRLRIQMEMSVIPTEERGH